MRPIDARVRRRIGVWLLIVSAALAALAATFLFGAGLRDRFGEIIGIVAFVSSVSGAVLITTSIEPVSTAKVIY